LARAVFYSLAAMDDGARARQWIQSIRSLRRYDRETFVYLILYGDSPHEVHAEAARQGVRIVDGGPHERLFANAPPGVGAALSRIPTLHKALSLRWFDRQGFDQLLYLDCDTFHFAPVAWVFDRQTHGHVLAREELGARRSRQPDPGHIDEARLMAIAERERLAPIPPINSGVMLFTGEAAEALARRAGLYLDYAWRLLVGLTFDSPLGARPDPHLRDLVASYAAPADRDRALPYPVANPWILEEVALWLALGALPGLGVGDLDCAIVAQGLEFRDIGDRTAPVIAHYFSAYEREFFERFGAL
jgi:hypothetical protein